MSSVRKLLMVAQNNPRVLKDPEPLVFFLNFAESTLDHELRIHVKELADRNLAIDEINREIDRLFKENGIEIAFRQLDVSRVPARGLRSWCRAIALTKKAAPTLPQNRLARQPHRTITPGDQGDSRWPGRSVTALSAASRRLPAIAARHNSASSTWWYHAQSRGPEKGHIVQINSSPISSVRLRSKAPLRAAAPRTRCASITCKPSRNLTKALPATACNDHRLPEAPVQFLYLDADGYTFMDNEDFAQFALNAEQLEEQLPYLRDGIEGLYGLLVEGNLVGIELPAVVEMAIEETPPAIKGSSASARTKTARFATGLEIQIPEYLETGEVVRINTESGKFMSRA